MLTFEQFNAILDDGNLDEGAVAAKTWHYTKAVARNIIPAHGHVRRYLTQRHVDRYKMHKRIANSPDSTPTQKAESLRKMRIHKAAIQQRMEED